jgi:hypothetical protein
MVQKWVRSRLKKSNQAVKPEGNMESSADDWNHQEEVAVNRCNCHPLKLSLRD